MNQVNIIDSPESREPFIVTLSFYVPGVNPLDAARTVAVAIRWSAN
jgi:hypothetical protein